MNEYSLAKVQSIINTSMIFNINIIWKDTTVIGVNHLLISWHDL